MSLNKYFQKRFALSPEGATSFISGVVLSTLQNIVLMLPALFMFIFLMEYLAPNDTPHGFWFYALLGLAFLFVIYIVTYFQYKSTYIDVYNESAKRRIGLAEKLRKLPLAFFGEKNLSDLTNTIMEDNSALEQIFSHAVPQLFASIISVILVGIGLFFYQWQLALALLWVVPLALLLVVISRRLMKKTFVENHRVKRGVSESIQAAIENVQEIKSYNGEAAYMNKFENQIKGYEKSLIKTELASGVLLNISYIFLKLGLPTVIIVGAHLLASGSVSLITYLVFLMISSIIYNPINEVLNNMAILSYLDVRLDRMREMEQMPVQEGKTEYSVLNYDIVFNNVSFAYEEGKQVLRDVSFTACQGDVTALVGPSGGGKSTSAKLAARFWDIDEGTITLGGEDISLIDPEALLRNYSVVFQDVVLFNASVADNIRIGRRDASDEDVMRVARLAQCEEFINRLPNGYNTLLGENGETLSGGERQRISIARALLKDAPIVLLDEATASIDVENETKIQAGISELIKDKTVLIIAHRIRTVANAHKIVVIKDGTVAEQGSPAELISRGGYYAEMVGSRESGVGSQKTEDRSQKTEDRSQKTEDRSQKTEVGSRESEDIPTSFCSSHPCIDWRYNDKDGGKQDGFSIG
ncbi:MAG TPA: ABC transporter ATP-binding protein [Petrimonas sp.]|jgi:ATP-binding cassette subfamily B protein|nr:ABC transporter ATP-binding protein [Petrimonas sp.]